MQTEVKEIISTFASKPPLRNIHKVYRIARVASIVFIFGTAVLLDVVMELDFPK